MKKTIAVLCILSIFILCACTAENSERPRICEELAVYYIDGGFDIYATFTASGKTEMKNGTKETKKYRGNTATEAFDKLIESEKKAMFKPIKKLILSKNSPYNAEIAKAFVNRSELQLKCTVYENEKGVAFPEYYRKITKDGAKNEN